MDLIAALKSELFRPLVTLVIPGSIASGPYVLVLGYYFPRVVSFWNDHPSAFVTMVTIAILAAGLIIEDLGAFIENDFWDGKLATENADHATNWDEYLKLKTQDEIIGQRYLRTVLVRMKFELAMVPALFFFWSGLLWLNRLYDVWRASRFVLMSGVILVLAMYMLLESYRSAAIMSNLRKLIICSVQGTTPTPAIDTETV